MLRKVVKFFSVLLFISQSLYGQTQGSDKLIGKVVLNDQPLSFALINLPEFDISVIADEEGLFTIDSISAQTTTIEVHHVGMQKQTVVIQETDFNKLFVIRLNSTAVQLNPVKMVITGTRTSRSSDC